MRKTYPAYLRIEVIHQVSIAEIQRVAKACVKPGSKIVSDGHSSYKPLADIGYIHESKAYYKEDKEDFLKMLHNIIGNVKTYIQGTFHGLASKHLQSYLDEFCFHTNRRQFEGQLFNRLLTVCVSTDTVTYHDLTA